MGLSLYVGIWKVSVVHNSYWTVLSRRTVYFMLYKMVLTFKSVDETLVCDHSNESYWAVLSCGTVYYAVQGSTVATFKSVGENSYYNKIQNYNKCLLTYTGFQLMKRRQRNSRCSQKQDKYEQQCVNKHCPGPPALMIHRQVFPDDVPCYRCSCHIPVVGKDFPGYWWLWTTMFDCVEVL